MEQTYDPVYDEQSPDKKQLYWDVAFGLQEVDNLHPSKYMRQLSEEHVRGEKTYAQVSEQINRYYTKELSSDNKNEKEADIVSDAIYEILSDKSFRFDVLTLKNYHKKLFENLDLDFFKPGEFRTYNITKKEPILNGDTVRYQSFDLIEESLKYDFEEERKQNYVNMSDEEKLNRIVEFTSKIWQIHPFCEGNTRATAVFIQKYLQSIGFDVNNELFKNHSLYFRNALVRANYSNYPKNVQADSAFLKMFFDNLLFGTSNVLTDSNLYIESLFR